MSFLFAVLSGNLQSDFPLSGPVNDNLLTIPIDVLGKLLVRLRDTPVFVHSLRLSFATHMRLALARLLFFHSLRHD